jgi:hypothetical protein
MGHERWMFFEVRQESGSLFRFEILRMTANQGREPSIGATLGIQKPPGRHEVVIDEPDDVEAIGDDDRLREMLPDNTPVGCRQIHAHHANLFLP